MTLPLLAAVAAGGFVGAPVRYLLDRAINQRLGSSLPWGTLAVNLSGAFVLGILTGLSLGHNLPGVARSLLGTGFCGAYTTFSTFTFETVRLVEDGQVLRAAVNAGGSILLGLAAAAAGIAIGLL